MRCNSEFYYVGIRGDPTYRYWAPVAAATHGFTMVLFTASHRNNFVGATCAPPSALLVAYVAAQATCMMHQQFKHKMSDTNELMPIIVQLSTEVTYLANNREHFGQVLGLKHDL